MPRRLTVMARGCLRVLLLFVVLELFNGGVAILDFTCVTKPRIDITQGDGNITSYFVVQDSSAADVKLTFSRIGSDGDVPGITNQFKFGESGFTVNGAIQRMGNSGAEMVGAFKCEREGEPETKILTMSLQADFVPVKLSQTKNRGDEVQLTVTPRNTARTNTRWKMLGRDAIYERYSDHLVYNIPRATIYRSGFYECHLVNESESGNQAFIRLIVRGCGKNRWNMEEETSCHRHCWVCFNGGICDDKSGNCICPPGFSGVNCEEALGPNRFGQKGNLRCDGPGLEGSSTCEGKLFCLPNPYGCSCAAGYGGIDCNKTCEDGSYGADCSQTCHCMDKASCNGTTGVCPGRCAHGFIGINCQEKCLPLNSNASCNTTCTDRLDSGRKPENLQVRALVGLRYTTALSWDPVNCSNGTAIVNYVYQILPSFSRSEIERVEGTTLYVDDLLPCRLYTFKVAAETTKSIGSFSINRNFKTGAEAPDPVEGLTMIFVDHQTIHLSWNASEANRGYPYDATEYRVTYTLVNLEQCQVVNRHFWEANAMNATSVALSGLNASSTYRMSVRPNNPVGECMKSYIKATTLETKPKMAPRLNDSFATNDSVTFSWNPIPCGSRGGNITGYSTRLLLSGEIINATNVTEEWVTFGGLSPCTKYTLKVQAFTSAGAGKALITTELTDIPEPNMAPVFNDSFVTSDSITLIWNPIPCGNKGGNITGYRTRLLHFEEVINATNVTAESITFGGLSPCTQYTLEVRAFTRVGAGEPLIIDVTTAIADRRGKLILRPSSNEIHASLITAGQRDNPCQYHVFYELLDMEQCSLQRDPVVKYAGILNSSTFVIHSLHPHSTYRVHVGLNNNAVTDFQKNETTKTKQNVPVAAPVVNSTVLSDGARFSWSPIPCGKRGGNITGYTFELRDSLGYLQKTGNTTDLSMTFDNLTQGESYSFNLSAYTPVGLGPWITVSVKLEKDKDEPTPTGGSSAGQTLGVIVCLLIIITVALMIAVFVKKRRQQKEAVVNAAAADGNRAKPVTAGNEKDLALQNLPSASGHESFADSSATASTDLPQTPPTNLSASTKPSSDKPLVVPGDAGSSSAANDTSKPGTSAPAMTPVKPKPYVKSTRPKLKTAAKSQPVFSQTGPVAMAQLAQYIKSRKSGKINGFQQDYETIPGEPLHPWTVAKKDYNRTKNRYTNILPYDHSRVVLETLEDNSQSDYINASYINGYKHKSRYIACQGPTVASVNDMWRMVWQERVGKIVMLANLVENGKGKCEQYWPDDGGADFGEMSVRNVDEASHDNYNVGTFHLSKKSEPEGEYRVVTQFHYTAWPDMKPPEASPLLQFLRKVRASETTQQGPIVVHCSAGVGRTGTFIALDAMLEQAQAEGQVDVLSFVRDMREQRFLMVQTLDQYKFIFDALLESMLLENTAIPADRFQHDYAKLKKRDKKTGTNGIEDQFQMLESFNVSPTRDQCAGGLTTANVDKNRFKHCIPKDSTRPYLMTEGDEGSTNYINAAFLDGYKGKNAYIGTQAPLPNTVGDIWRMVFDYKSTCIVMLNSMDSDPRVAKYWPEKDELKSFGPLNVTLRFEDRRRDNLIIRHFEIVRPLRKSDEVQSVCQIQYLGWPTGKDVPVSAASLLQVLLEVRKWTDNHPDGPVTVHCIDGVECTGAFCILITLLDRLKEEKIVDVFQAVKKLRTIRPGVVQNLAQYQFCYKVIQTYLDSSSIYENLK